MQLMGNAPHDFCLHHTDKDLKRLLHFKHRTFNATDLLYFIAFFKFHYTKHKSPWDCFYQPWHNSRRYAERFSSLFLFTGRGAARTRKHIATPERGSPASGWICSFAGWFGKMRKELTLVSGKIDAAQPFVRLICMWPGGKTARVSETKTNRLDNSNRTDGLFTNFG